MAKGLKGGVGRSSRTPVKHYLLNALLGKTCGVLSRRHWNVPCRVTERNPLFCVDLCGGDGLKTDGHDASPLIMFKHCKWMKDKHNMPATLHVIEKAANTFEQLRINCHHMPPDIVSLTCGDARDYRLPVLAENQPAFVHCDPNTVDQMPLTKPFVQGFNRYTLYLVTLGCNVSGIKMLPLEKRRTWSDYVAILIDVLPDHHDAVLFWLNKDGSQWAYLLSIPTKWSAEFTAYSLEQTSRHWEKGVSAVSYRSGRHEMMDRLAQLFLTREEYASL